MIGKKAPDFILEGYQENEEYITRSLSKDYNDKYVVLIFYPHDFTFVCPTEVLGFSDAHAEFNKLSAEIVFISCDSKYVHKAWCGLDPSKGGVKGNIYPMLSDVDRKVSTAYQMMNEESGVSARGIVILDKDKEIRFFAVYDDKIGRNVEEVMRIVDNIKYMEENKDAMFCPLNFIASKHGKK